MYTGSVRLTILHIHTDPAPHYVGVQTVTARPTSIIHPHTHIPLPPTRAHTQLAHPPEEINNSLALLCEDPGNIVFIISGRKKDDLQEWLGHIPNLGLMAENGFWCRIPAELQARSHVRQTV